MYLDFLGEGLFRELAEEFGDSVYDNGQHSLRELEARIDADPTSMAHIRSLGFRFLQDAKPIRAGHYFDKALAMVPADQKSRLGMACTHEALNRCQTAIDYLQPCLDSRPEDCPSLVAMGFCQARLGEKNEAIRMYELALRVNPCLVRTREKLESLLPAERANTESHFLRELAEIESANR